MQPTRPASAVLDRDFLEVRGKILEVAAALDRLDRAPDRRVAALRQALEALLVPDLGRVETIQRIFSLDYLPDWREEFGFAGGTGEAGERPAR